VWCGLPSSLGGGGWREAGEGEGIGLHDSFRNFGNNLFGLFVGPLQLSKDHDDGTLQSV
jgi:hypothetical protein